MLSHALNKVNGLIQYFGKCMLPFNLNVFPTIENTSTLWGIAALLITGILIAMNKKRNTKEILFGAAWFVLFLLPVFFVPKNINNQFFEHRLYLPMIGILFLLRQTILFSSTTNVVRKTIFIMIGAVWIIIIQLYLPDFKDTFSFWNQAVAASPDNAYANKMLGIKLSENERKDEAIPYIEKAYMLDSTEKYVHLFFARLIYMPQQKWDSARYMLESEISITPQFSDNYAELAHVCFEMKDWAAVEKYILKYLELNPKDQMLNTNLLLLYNDQKKYKQAVAHADKMKAMGIVVDENFYRVITDSAKIKFSGIPDSTSK
jgi:protein O-mannosyl-transferase